MVERKEEMQVLKKVLSIASMLFLLSSSASAKQPLHIKYRSQAAANVAQFGYKIMQADSSIIDEATNLEDLADQSSIPGKIQGDLLNFPNPFKAQEGTSIGYRLTKDMSVELKIYNILGQEVFGEKYEAGSLGGQAGYNLVPLEFSNNLASSVYSYVLLYEDKIIGQSKMGVRP